MEKQIESTSSQIQNWEGLDGALAHAQSELNKILKDPEGYIKTNMPTSRTDNGMDCLEFAPYGSIHLYANSGGCKTLMPTTTVTPINQTAAEKASWYNYQVKMILYLKTYM